ncbi:MAG: PAS domain S-box protein [Methanomicrobiales archaeon]|nr:PAS domain S-box protein [Methanomicrobiales archaeon]
MRPDIRWWHIIALVIIIAGVFLTIWTAQQQDLRMRTELLTKAKIATESIDPVRLETLNGSPSDITSPDYQYQKAKLARIRAADPSIQFAYLMGQRPGGGVFFYGDSEPVDSPDYSPPGQEYPEVSALFLKAFSEKAELTEGPSSDRWGTSVSAIVPITDPETGQLIAVFGMDVEAKNWNSAIVQASASIITATLLILVLVVTFGLIQRRNRREERRLAASEAKFSRAFHTNPALMAVSFIEDGRFLDVNSSFLKALGYTREEVIGRTPIDLGLYSDPAQWDFIQGQITENGHVGDLDLKVIRKSHNTLDGSFSATPIDVGGISCLLTLILDITERKRAEEALYMSLVMDSIPTRLCYVDADLRYVYVNNAYAEWYGKTRKEFRGKSISDVKGEAVFRQDLPHYQVVLSGRPVSFERIDLGEEGFEHFEIVTLVPHYDGGLVTGFFASILDITERTRAEEALRQSEEKFRGIFDTINDGIHIHETGPDGMPGQFIEVNEVACRMLGFSREELLEHGPLDFVTGYHNRPVNGIIEELASTGHSFFETEHRRKDGSIVPVEINSHVVSLQGKRMTVAVVRDITERKRAENTLKRVNQKLNFLSQLTRQDLTSQIFVLNSYLELAKKQAAGQGQILESIQKGKRAAESIYAITEITKNYQDMGAKPPKWQNVKMAMLFGLSHIPLGEIQHSIETEGLEIFADSLLEKAFQRLCESSFTHGVRVTRTRLWKKMTAGELTIFFEDDGIGIPPEKKEQIFLRSEGVTRASRGSLIFVREILDITGITITETGEPGRGARFEMTVPKGAWRMAVDGD